MSTDSSLSDEHRQQIASELQAFQHRGNSPAGLGWAIMNFALENAASLGTLNGDTLELPMIASISLPSSTDAPAASSTEDQFSETTACHSVCYTILGHQIYCHTTCTSHMESITHTHT